MGMKVKGLKCRIPFILFFLQNISQRSTSKQGYDVVPLTSIHPSVYTFTPLRIVLDVIFLIIVKSPTSKGQSQHFPNPSAARIPTYYSDLPNKLN